MKTALLFSGQGSQTVGMGRDLCEKYEVCRKLFTHANEVLGRDIQKICFEGPVDVLTKTDNAQPAIFLTSLACFEALKSQVPDLVFDATAGLSLGEFTALAAAALDDAKRKIVELIREIESLKAQSADERLARFILSLCPPDKEQCRFRLPYDKRLVAAQLGVTQETLSRAFARLREFGVRTETRDVSVESITRLCLQYDEIGRHRGLPAPTGARRVEEGRDAL